MAIVGNIIKRWEINKNVLECVNMFRSLFKFVKAFKTLRNILEYPRLFYGLLKYSEIFIIFGSNWEYFQIFKSSRMFKVLRNPLKVFGNRVNPLNI